MTEYNIEIILWLHDQNIKLNNLIDYIIQYIWINLIRQCNLNVDVLELIYQYVKEDEYKVLHNWEITMETQSGKIIEYRINRCSYDLLILYYKLWLKELMYGNTHIIFNPTMYDHDHDESYYLGNNFTKILVSEGVTTTVNEDHKFQDYDMIMNALHQKRLTVWKRTT